MISLRGINKTYQQSGSPKVVALRNVDLEIGRGEFLVVTGRSGCGKTTLLNTASGLSRPTSGTVTHDGTDIWTLSDDERAQRRNLRLGFVFQFPSLLPALTVLDNVMLPLQFAHRSDDAGRRRATDLLRLVDLGDRLNAYPRQLSAGQQQRVVIARALVNQPELLLADEPSSDLDEETELDIMDLFSRIFQECGVTIVMVTHSRDLVAYGNRHVEMAAGTIRHDRAAREQTAATIGPVTT